MNNNSVSTFIIKQLIIGDSMTGKSSIMIRYCDNKFIDSVEATVGVDFRYVSVQKNGRHFGLQIWDTAGQEQFRTIINSYYRGSHAIMIVYDITNEKSFEQVVYWFNEAETYAPKEISKLLVGNKKDQEKHRVITYQQGKDLADSYNSGFIEVSAKTGENIKEAFELLGFEQFNKLSNENLNQKEQEIHFQIVQNNEKEKKKENCC
ncbi:ras and ef-hand domain-containing protein [Anaeramoeba ignava]|uniref:Ras and ef-hand domain-containing protein n=1 Tax=Anaeramoeba ignava TaxID=1746090 RepID=A0A9Q0LTK2_ANAIG|nr:ras and ef-hand domain-containing protein [Anaeramoeba ignava]